MTNNKDELKINLAGMSIEDIDNYAINLATEESLTEAKADQQNFINKFGQETFDKFNKLKDRIKNNKISTDLTYHIKNTSVDEMNDILVSAENYYLDKQTGNNESKQIKGDYEYLGEKNGYKVYKVNDYIASFYLGSNTGWCISGRWGHYGDESNANIEEAEKHWKDYTEKGIEFYFFISSKTKYALALYPKVLNVHKDIDGSYLQETNVELFNAVDEIDYSVINKLPLDLIKEQIVLDIETYDEQGLIVKDSTMIKCKQDAVNVIIPDSVTSIGWGAFGNCTSLTSITIPDSVTSIGDWAFYCCKSLTSITIPNSVKSIGNSAFSDCSSLTSITIPSSVTTIEEYAFCRCSSLTSIIIPSSVTSIGRDAFYSSGIKSVVIQNGVTSIGNSAFLGCSSLESVTIPDSVKSISSYAFSECSSLTSVTIPNGVTKIGDNAFRGCSSLTSITIPDSIIYIGRYAFHYCPSLTVHTNNEYIINYCKENKINCKPINNESLQEKVSPQGYEPTKKGIAYKVFKVKNGKLYPPMVANANNEDTPIGVWLDAEEGEFAGLSKTGRPQVKSIDNKNLSYRPGWHLGDIPRAKQFDRLNKETGEYEFPKDFVWAECEYAMDVDYQPESDARGYERTKVDKDGNVITYKSNKYQHSLAGVPHLPTNGYYKYRTNPNPDTVPWVITGQMKVNRILSDEEVNNILKSKGIAPIHRQGGDKTLKELGLQEKLNKFGYVKQRKVVEDYHKEKEGILQDVDDTFGQDEVYNWSTFILPNGHFLNPDTPKGKEYFEDTNQEPEYEHSDFIYYEYNPYGEDLFNDCVKINVTFPYLGIPVHPTPQQYSSIQKFLDEHQYSCDTTYDMWKDYMEDDVMSYPEFTEMREPLLVLSPIGCKAYDMSYTSGSDVVKSIKKSFISGVLEAQETKTEEDLEKHDELNPSLFDGNNMRPEVRNKLLEIAGYFISKAKEDGVEFDIKDILLVGSNANYNYTKDSDVDLHIVVSKKPDCNKEHLGLIYQAYKSMFNNKFDCTIYGIPVEIYVEFEDDEVIEQPSDETILDESNLTPTTPYMLRNDGKLLTCGSFHPYIKTTQNQSLSSVQGELANNPQRIKWFKEHSKLDETKLLCDKCLSGEITEEEIDRLNDLTNQEFCRVRTSNFKVKVGGDNGEIYFRISSKDFNWFDLIWKVVFEHKNSIKNVTVVKDTQSLGGKEFNYYIIDGKPLSHIDTEEFLTLKGNPVLESED